MYDSDVSRPIKEIITNYLVSNYVGDCNDCDIIILPGEQPMDIPILYNANKIGKNTKVHCFFNILSDELNHGRREDKIRYYNAMIRKNIKIETNDADFANDSIIINFNDVRDFRPNNGNYKLVYVDTNKQYDSCFAYWLCAISKVVPVGGRVIFNFTMNRYDIRIATLNASDETDCVFRYCNLATKNSIDNSKKHTAMMANNLIDTVSKLTDYRYKAECLIGYCNKKEAGKKQVTPMGIVILEKTK
jgi:hypothetical protein